MKGISNIITSVILVGVSIAVVGIYSGWAPGFAENITESAVEGIESDMRCDNADFRADAVEYSSSAGIVYLEIINTGTITFHEDLTVYALESSRIIGEEEINRLEVDDSINVEVFTDFEEPDTVVLSSSDCSELDVETSSIAVS